MRVPTKCERCQVYEADVSVYVLPFTATTADPDEEASDIHTLCAGCNAMLDRFVAGHSIPKPEERVEEGE